MDEKELWENAFTKYRYSDNVFSLLDSDKVLDKIKKCLTQLSESNSVTNILIPGCGSNPNLQICCKEVLGENVHIDALDWSKEAIDISKEKTDKLGIKVSYFHQSYYDLSLPRSDYDLIISSNAFVSKLNDNNISAITNLSLLLRPSGHFICFLPSPFNMLDYALTNPEAKKWIFDGTVDIENRTINGDYFSGQRFFSPLELYMLFKKLNFSIYSFELFFFDDANFAKQISELHELTFNPNYCFWGYFINTVKQ